MRRSAHGRLKGLTLIKEANHMGERISIVALASRHAAMTFSRFGKDLGKAQI
jgi:hypothetical protein